MISPAQASISIKRAFAKSAVALAAATAATFFALPASATSCRLSTSACSLVIEEMRAAEVRKLMDDIRLQHMQSFPRRLAVIDLHHARLTARLKVLPKPVANEIMRIYGCEAGVPQKSKADCL